MAVTIRDLAERLNLSKSTVSYALNGGPKPVSDSVRRRVEEAAREMGFRPNEIARSLAVGRTYTIGFIPSSLRQRTLRSWFERTALEAICVAAEAKGLHLLLPATHSDPSGKANGIGDPQFASRVDGAILLAPPTQSNLAEYLTSRSVPIAIVATRGIFPGPCFDADNVSGASTVADHLYSLGHRQIGIVTQREHSDVLLRHDAFLARLRALGLDIAPEHIEHTDLHVEGGYSAGMRLLRRANRPTAVFCVNDPTAIGLMQAARELGIGVPEQLSVVGFDNDDIGATVFPGLTTVHQPVAEMAVTAFESVLAQIVGERGVGRTFPTQLIVRATTRPLEDKQTHA